MPNLLISPSKLGNTTKRENVGTHFGGFRLHVMLLLGADLVGGGYSGGDILDCDFVGETSLRVLHFDASSTQLFHLDVGLITLFCKRRQ